MQPSTFPECPWALPLSEKTCVKTTRGDWDWETDATRDHVTENEQIRDYGLHLVYRNCGVLKNHPKFKDKFARQRLTWVAYIGGKRESRRLLEPVRRRVVPSKTPGSTTGPVDHRQYVRGSSQGFPIVLVP